MKEAKLFISQAKRVVSNGDSLVEIPGCAECAITKTAGISEKLTGEVCNTCRVSLNWNYYPTHIVSIL